MLLLGLALHHALAQPRADFEEEEPLPPEEEASYEDEDGEFEEEDRESLFDSSRIREFASRLQRKVDADGLLRARRWGNIANGALLAATGPVTLTYSLFSMRLSNVVLSLYVAALGAVLAGIELGTAPVGPWISTNLHYLTTQQGRTALLAFLGGLTFPLGKLGVVPAVLTCVNAFFNNHFNALLAFVSADDGHSSGGGARAEPAAQVEARGGEVDAAEELERAAQAMQEAQAAQARAQAEAEAAAAEAEAEAAAAAQAAAAEEASAAAEQSAAAARLQAMEEALAQARSGSASEAAEEAAEEQ